MALIEALVEAIRPGGHVFIAGSAGEPTSLLDAWTRDPDRTRDLRVTTSAVPGINRLDAEAWHPTVQVEGLFMQPAFNALHREGRYHWLPISYGAFTKHVRERADPPDTCVVQVSPPGPDGMHSLGLAAEFMPVALERAEHIFGLVNHAMPYVARAPKISPKRLALSVEVETALRCYDSGDPDPASIRIAESVAGFIRDGDAVQVGIGKVPAALMAALTGHRRLRIQSGMLGEGFRLLSEAGALDADWAHQGCVMVGRQSLYDWAAQSDMFEIAGCERTHDAGFLAGIDRLVAVNSALEVDLFGQCNLEMAGTKAVSGAGGAPDFARAARLGRSGISIVALQATARGGSISRILPSLTSLAIASLPRTDVDVIVTENGVADLRGLDTVGRGLKIASVAEPKFRDALIRDWQALTQAM